METKQIKINELVPQGYEIDLENSTIENIILKPIEVKLPLSVFEIQRLDTAKYKDAFEALEELVHLRDSWNGNWKADWENDEQKKYCILKCRNKIIVKDTHSWNAVLTFKTEQLAKKFAEQFKDLIHEAKELL